MVEISKVIQVIQVIVVLLILSGILYFTNLFVATLMCCGLFNLMQGKLEASETYFDITKMCSDTKYRAVNE